MKLCEACGQPQVIHLGYDRGLRRCLLARNWLDLAVFHGEERAKAMVREANEWHAQQAVEEEARLQQGAYI